MISRSRFSLSGSSRMLTAACCAATLAAAAPWSFAEQAGSVEIAQLQIGFAGAYKLGCWTPIEVQLQSDGRESQGVVEVTATDSEGVPVITSTPPDRPLKIEHRETTSARLFIRPGQDGAPIEVRFIDDGGRVQAARTFYPGAGADFPTGLPATNRLIASLGAARGVSDLIRSQHESDQALATEVAKLRSADDLPLQWIGYEGVELVILSTAQPEQFQGLSYQDPRIIALRRWIELGGRLVIFAGANGAELLRPEGPLARLIPGRFDAVVPLREAQPIETLSGTATVIGSSPERGSGAIVSGQQFQMPAPRLTEVRGRILAHGGPNPTDLPLVIQTHAGLGEITFVAFDPDAPPLADWSGRTNLLRQILEWPPPMPSGELPLPAYGQNDDLIDRLRRALDASITGVTLVPFSWVAAGVVLYVVLIGPADYFLLRKVLKRETLTWFTFPLAALAVAAAAYWLAHRTKGAELRVNQVEIVDVDLAAAEARGTVWTHFFNPQVTRRDLRLTPRFGGEPAGSSHAAVVGWIGSTGFGLDGMQGRQGQLALFDRGYALSPSLDAIHGLPAPQWSTRTITGRWTAAIEPPLEAQLTELADNLLAGHITNRTGLKLDDCVLMHANWAYVLPPLAEGAVATIDQGLQPRTVRTALTIGDRQRTGAAPRLDPLSASVAEIASAMMFYDAIGGRDYAQAVNRYQSFVDLSRALKGEQAILMARAADAAGSRWMSGDEPLESPADRRWTYYRFLIPLASHTADN
ncbi:MAG: hypothetical protein IT424_11075 [Pirellulales bacterium]|nr:hypothetical protein [Pirellulales bacterium]